MKIREEMCAPTWASSTASRPTVSVALSSLGSRPAAGGPRTRAQRAHGLARSALTDPARSALTDPARRAAHGLARSALTAPAEGRPPPRPPQAAPTVTVTYFDCQSDLAPPR